MRPGYVLPATPPPDIDLERWEQSLQRIEAWRPSRSYLTHFGEGDAPRGAPGDVPRVAGALRRSVVRQSLAEGDDDEAADRRLGAWLRADVRAARPEAAATAAEVAAPFRQLWLGLARYWRKREAEPRA